MKLEDLPPSPANASNATEVPKQETPWLLIAGMVAFFWWLRSAK